MLGCRRVMQKNMLKFPWSKQIALSWPGVLKNAACPGFHSDGENWTLLSWCVASSQWPTPRGFFAEANSSGLPSSLKKKALFYFSQECQDRWHLKIKNSALESGGWKDECTAVTCCIYCWPKDLSVFPATDLGLPGKHSPAPTSLTTYCTLSWMSW